MYPDNVVTDPVLRAKIEALLTEHAFLIDHHQCERIADLYTADGAMVGAGHDTVGRAALEEWGRNRARMAHRRSRHVLSNLRIVAESADRLRSWCIVTLYRFESAGTGPARPIAIAELQDRLERGADGRWRISEHRIVPVFESEMAK